MVEPTTAGRLSLFRGPGCVLDAKPVSQKRITLSTAPLEKPWQKTQWEIVRATGKFGLWAFTCDWLGALIAKRHP